MHGGELGGGGGGGVRESKGKKLKNKLVAIESEGLPPKRYDSLH